MRFQHTRHSWLLVITLVAAAPLAAREDYQIAGCHVVESDEAAYQLRKAEKLAEDGKWAECCELYLNIIEKWPDSLCGIQEVEGRHTLYVGTLDYVRHKLLAFPPAGRAAFRTLYDARIDTQFALARASGDRASLQEIADTFFLASRGDDALWLLAHYHREEGRADRALPLLERLLRLDSDVPPAAIHARIAECLAALGKPDLIEAMLSDPAVPIDHRIRLGDGEVALGEYLARLAERPATVDGLQEAPDRWASFGGNGTRNGAMGPDLALPPRAWAWRIPTGATRRLGGGFFIDPSDDLDLVPSQRSQVIPALVDGVVYVHNDIGLWAFDVVADKPKVLWKYETSHSPSLVLPEERILHTVTVHEGIVYANLVCTVESQKQQLDFLIVQAPIPRRALMAFSTRTGKLLWTIGGQKDAKDKRLRASFQAAPAAERGRLYVGAAFQKERPTDPVEQHVFCLDAKTGEVIWSRYIAEGYLEMNLFNNPTREIVGSSVTIDTDTVYICTNFGVIAALDKETGEPRWLRRYQQYRIPPTRDLYVPPMPSGWENNPIIVVGDSLFVGPMDSPFLYVLSATSGEDRWPPLSRDRGGRSPVQNGLWILGAQSDRVVIAARERVVAIEVRTGKLKWDWKPPLREMIVGRGGLSRTTAYIPCLSGLYRLDIASGEPDGTLLGYDKWIDPKHEGGNVVVADNTVVTVSGSTLSTFYSWEVLAAYLDRELAKSPNNPALRLRVARSLLQAKRTDGAVGHLEKALELTEASPDPGAARIAAEARDLLVQLHRTVGDSLLEEGKADAAASEFRAALRFAAEPADRVRARRDLAKALTAAGKAREAVAELSRIIAEDPDVAIDGGRAWDAARLDIAGIVRRVGPAAYAEAEENAQKMLAAAGEREKETAEVVRLYPNSRAAEDAAYRLATIALKDGRLEEAAARLRNFVRDHPESERYAQANIDLAEVYRKRGMGAKARVVLRQVARRLGDARVVVEGRETTVSEYLQRVLGASAALAPLPLPEVAWPVDRSWDLSERRADSIRVLPVSGAPPDAAKHQILISTGRRLKSVDREKGTVLWEREFGSDPSCCGWTEGGLVVVLERDGVAAVDSTNGEVRWSADVTGLFLGSAVTENAAYALVADRANLMMQRLVAIDAKTGRPLWESPLEGRQASNDLWVTEDSLVVATTSREGRGLLIVDRDNGQADRSIEIESGIGKVLLLPPDQIAVVTGDRNENLRVYEVSSGEMLWMASARRIDTETLCSNGVALAYVAVNAAGALEVVVMDVESGKVAARAPIGTQDYVKGAAIDDEHFFVTFRETKESRQIYVRAFSLVDASARWRQPIASGDTYLVLPLLVTRGAVIVPTPMQKNDDRDNPFVPVFTVVGSKDGDVEQQVRMAVRGRFPPDLRVVDGMVLVVQGNRLYGMRAQAPR